MKIFPNLRQRRQDRQTDPRAVYQHDGQDTLLPRIGLFVFEHNRIAALLWVLLATFGVVSYTTLLKREGFPSVNIPITLISGAYLVNDPAKVDKEVAKPISDIVLKDSRVKSVQTQSRGAFYAITVQYTSTDADTNAINKQLNQRIADAKVLPKQASYKVESPRFGFTDQGDNAVVAVYSNDTKATPAALQSEANKLTDFLQKQHIDGIRSVTTISPFTAGTNLSTGEQSQTQTKFDRYAKRSSDGKVVFYPAVSIGIMQKAGDDVISIDDKLRHALDTYNSRHGGDSFTALVSASYANDIKSQISELQRALLEGLAAVLVIGSLIIAVRASLITVLSMVTVLAVTAGVLYLVGYTLNTITLFSLILCLGLVVDDTIIMVEAIDAQRRRLSSAREVIRTATRRVSRAMVAATFTAALSFAPLLFVGGILGGFIRAIPITVITSLLISLTVALVFIPLFARYLLLRPKQLGEAGVVEPAARLESRIALALSRPMRWAQHSRGKLVGVGLSAVLVGVAFIAAGVLLFQKVSFNIFPPSKDSNGLVVQLAFEPGTTISQAESVSDRAGQQIVKTLGNTFESAAYYARANERKAELAVQLTPYKDRDERSPQLRDKLQQAFQGFSGAKITVNQQDVGPPPSNFEVFIETDNRDAAARLANDMRAYLYGRELQRTNGTTAHINDVTVADRNVLTRANSKLYMSVSVGFDSTDTTTLVDLARKAVEKQYTGQRLASFGLPKDTLHYDIGQEQENQDSFKSLALAFPILLVVIYLLLALQFRSLLQPLLIFMAIPFSLFGITLGLYLTDNAFSFFAMLGFFALIGLSLKNSILLTDYANQLRRNGASAVDAAIGALQERFRPLVATSLTAVVSLIPLAISSPFWEGLAVVLICGLLSSTFLVITVFPYYYLGAEFMRLRVRRTPVLLWLAATVVAAVGISWADQSPGYIVLLSFIAGLIMVVSFRKVSDRVAD